MNYCLYIFKENKFIEMETTEARSKRLGVNPDVLRKQRSRSAEEAAKGVLIDNKFYYYKHITS